MVYTFAKEMTIKDLKMFLDYLIDNGYSENFPLLFPNGSARKIVCRVEENETPEDNHPGYLIMDMGEGDYSCLGAWKLKESGS